MHKLFKLPNAVSKQTPQRMLSEKKKPRENTACV